jgi:hypothetical protein
VETPQSASGRPGCAIAGHQTTRVGADDGRREVLERVRIVNGVEGLAAVIARAGQGPEVVLEATGAASLGELVVVPVPNCIASCRFGWRLRGARG